VAHAVAGQLKVVGPTHTELPVAGAVGLATQPGAGGVHRKHRLFPGMMLLDEVQDDVLVRPPAVNAQLDVVFRLSKSLLEAPRKPTWQVSDVLLVMELAP